MHSMTTRTSHQHKTALLRHSKSFVKHRRVALSASDVVNLCLLNRHTAIPFIINVPDLALHWEACRDGDIGDTRGALALADAIAMSPVASFELDNHISLGSLHAFSSLVRALFASSVLQLNLVGCHLWGLEGIRVLGTELAARASRLMALDLSLCDLHGRAGVEVLAGALLTNTTLRELRLCCCALDDASARLFATVLQFNTSLEVLDLSGAGSTIEPATYPLVCTNFCNRGLQNAPVASWRLCEYDAYWFYLRARADELQNLHRERIAAGLVVAKPGAGAASTTTNNNTTTTNSYNNNNHNNTTSELRPVSRHRAKA